MSYLTRLRFILLIGAFVLPLFAMPAFANSSTVIVDGNPDDGWMFNPDPANVTPAGFTDVQASIGDGSIHVEPIQNVANAEKFILQYEPSSPILVKDFESFSIDFKIDGDQSKFKQFYINFYVLTPDPNDGSWYDCRFDYIASSGSATDWTALAFASTDAANAKGDKIGGACPSSPSGMPEGSTILRLSVNLGDTSGNDTGLGGYFDNAQLTVAGSTTTFDFEPYKVPATADDCKDGGWQNVKKADGTPFKNQGDCIQYVNTGK